MIARDPTPLYRRLLSRIPKDERPEPNDFWAMLAVCFVAVVIIVGAGIVIGGRPV